VELEVVRREGWASKELLLEIRELELEVMERRIILQFRRRKDRLFLKWLGILLVSLGPFVGCLGLTGIGISKGRLLTMVLGLVTLK
jgi:hypothetical protein